MFPNTDNNVVFIFFILLFIQKRINKNNGTYKVIPTDGAVRSLILCFALQLQHFYFKVEGF